jgi:hypothetical protein
MSSKGLPRFSFYQSVSSPVMSVVLFAFSFFVAISFCLPALHGCSVDRSGLSLFSIFCYLRSCRFTAGW